MPDTKPVRLNQEMMRSATMAAKRANRTSTEQIEYWALLSQEVNKAITLDDMLNVLCGIAKLKVGNVSD